MITARSFSFYSVLLSVLILLPALSGFSGILQCKNMIYSPSIKTVQVYKEGFEMSSPVIMLHSGERVLISFDDLSDELKRYRFTIVHCTSDWMMTKNVSPSEYMDGYHEDNINTFSYSFNTTVQYIHYQAFFPTAGMTPRISGNYLLKVYNEEAENLAFTLRILVIEPTQVSITGNISQSPVPSERFERQMVNFVIRFNGFQVNNPEQEINACIRQNDRWDNISFNVRPRFIRGDELDYSDNEQQIFNGGNEFRAIDIKSLLYQSERIENILYDTTYQVFLLNDLPRPIKNYILEKDINGRYFIKNDEHVQNSAIEADYAWVHFFLQGPSPLTKGTFHLLGQMTEGLSPEYSALKYDSNRSVYSTNLFLKQGLYNYFYIFIPDGTNNGDETLIEGNHWETENMYTVLVYYHPEGGLFDRLIAITDISSTTP